MLLAPIVFALHVVEEAPGFVAWFNSLVPARPITDDLFYTVNAVAFVITVVVAGVLAATREAGAALGALAWISFLMLANGLFHGCASVPAYSMWFVRQTIRRYSIETAPAATAIILGMAPMLAHGYLIVFTASRLF